MASPFVLSGVNCTTGEYLPTPPSVNELYQALSGHAAQDETKKPNQKDLRDRYERDKQGKVCHYGVAEWIEDANRLDQSGWGVIFPTNAPAELSKSLEPLLQHRAAQVKDPPDRKVKYFQVFEKPRGYAPGDDKGTYLTGKLKRGVGQPADPKKGVPYYLLLVGSAAEIPWEFQFDLDVEYAVGRLYFADGKGGHDYAAYRRYAESVVRAETSAPQRTRQANFFAPRHDMSTEYSAEYLVKPLVAALKERETLAKWNFDAIYSDKATKPKLSDLFHSKEASFLFTAGHGGWFEESDPRAAQDQGALLCQKTGTFAGGPVQSNAYFSHADLAKEADFTGLISFHFACFGLGTPSIDSFPDMITKTFPNGLLRQQPEVARLPMSLLSHPGGGALAFVGHVDRAWSCSFLNAAHKEDSGTFSSALGQLLKGSRLGWAMEYFNQRNAALAVQINSKLQLMKIKAKKETDPFKEEYVADWLEQTDARNYAIFGDPAVKLTLRDDGG